ncbi:MAG: translation initiation factor IF-2 [Gemmatimonadales bacterium]
MAKTRVHELATEFGIESDHVIKLLSGMDIHVRSHLSSLDDGQVALVRARWERDKRRKPEKVKKPRRRARGTAPAKTAALAKKHPVRRRRTAADVAAMTAAQETQEEALPPDTKEAGIPLEVRAEEPAALVFPADSTVVTPDSGVADAVVEEVAPPAAAGEELAVGSTSESVARPQAPEPFIGQPGPGAKSFVPHRIPRPVVSAIKPVASATPRPVASAAPGDIAEERRREKKKRKRGKRASVDREAVQANISRTLATLKTGAPKKTKVRRGDEPGFRELEELRREEEKELEKVLVRVNEFITVSELAETLQVPSTDIVAFCFKQLGMMVTVNQRLDFDQIELIAGEFGFNAVREEEYAPTDLLVETEDAEEDLRARPPVVTVMGHVDHGKTSLLDHIRKTNVIAGEAGSITQHIGAYHVEREGGKVVTFLDTPGHEAFTAMRARGAQVTDLVVLVVAADDQVMPQTVEAISHARTAGVPLIVAINKIDLPAANVEKVKQDLLQHEVVLEEFGGDVLASAISAKTGEGIEDLFERILLQAEVLDLKANPKKLGRGAVIESALDPGKGPVATVLVQTGTVKTGQDFICGNQAGRVRAMFDERGKKITSAGPSVPVQVLGFEGVPYAGDVFTVVASAHEAREIAQKRHRLDREASHRRTSRAVSLEDVSKQIEEGMVQVLRIIIKADQGGPAEALADAFHRISTDEVRVEVIHRGVGAINESDVLLAKASDAIVIGFHVRPDGNARAAAEREKVEIKTYRVIYEAVDEIRAALEGLLAPEQREIVLGEAEVRQIFKISGVGTIAGCSVNSGVIQRTAQVRVVRGGVEIYGSKLASLKRFKEDVREVREGLECGIGVENFNDLKVGDVLEAFIVQEIARTLDTADVGGES